MSRSLTTEDLKALATAFKVEPAALLAVLKVESGKSGFRADGRLVILLEAHHVWKRLLARKINPLPFMKYVPMCCQPTWAKAKQYYNTDSWRRIEAGLAWVKKYRATQYDSYRRALLESCSMGRPQIMGWHYANLGYENIDKMVEDFERGEREQIFKMLEFMQRNNLLVHLRTRNWRAFARGYNGSGQVDLYSGRLIDAYENAKRQV
jgi:hypothetical protein